MVASSREDVLQEENSKLCDAILRERRRRMAAEDAKNRLIDENTELWAQVRDLKARIDVLEGL